MTPDPATSESSDRFAVVLRAEVEPPAVEPMPAEANLLQTLYDRIGCRAVDAVGLRIDRTELTGWVDDEGAITPAHRMNVQAMRLAANAGRPGLILFGTAVITGGPDPGGATLGLSAQLADRVVSHAADTRRSVDRLIVRALLMQETPATVVERVASNLYWSRVLTAPPWEAAPTTSAGDDLQSRKDVKGGHDQATSHGGSESSMPTAQPRRPQPRRDQGPSATPGGL